MLESQTILTSIENGVLRIVLNRPDKLNAFNEEMHLAFHAALSLARDEPLVFSVLLTGAGRGFCAGQDLGKGDQSDEAVLNDLGDTLEKFYNPAIRLIRNLEKTVVCAVNGVAAGAGANIAFACDIVLAAKSAKFIQSFSKIGLVPDSGGSWFLTRTLGEHRAKALALMAEPLTAETAADWGLIWKAIDDDLLMQEAEKIAQSMASGPTLGLGLTKTLIHAASSNSLDHQLDRERDSQRRAGQSADYSEGVSAYFDRRKPTFAGH